LEILHAACKKEILAGNFELQIARKNLGQIFLAWKFFRQLACKKSWLEIFHVACKKESGLEILNCSLQDSLVGNS
jgi:hypothetical protein